MINAKYIVVVKASTSLHLIIHESVNVIIYDSSKIADSNGQNDSNTLSNVENAALEKIPYPKRVFFIIGNEFCERFNFYGMKSKYH